MDQTDRFPKGKTELRIYVASSWRNEDHAGVVEMLRKAGHAVYDFKEANSAFSWKQIDPQWSSWDREKFIGALATPLAVDGFRSDFEAMQWANVCVAVAPFGNSASMELGWSVGAGKLTILLAEKNLREPELMVSMVNHMALDRSSVAGLLFAYNIMLLAESEARHCVKNKDDTFNYACSHYALTSARNRLHAQLATGQFVGVGRPFLLWHVWCNGRFCLLDMHEASSPTLAASIGAKRMGVAASQCAARTISSVQSLTMMTDYLLGELSPASCAGLAFDGFLIGREHLTPGLPRGGLLYFALDINSGLEFVVNASSLDER